MGSEKERWKERAKERERGREGKKDRERKWRRGREGQREKVRENKINGGIGNGAMEEKDGVRDGQIQIEGGR